MNARARARQQAANRDRASAPRRQRLKRLECKSPSRGSPLAALRDGTRRAGGPLFPSRIFTMLVPKVSASHTARLKPTCLISTCQRLPTCGDQLAGSQQNFKSLSGLAGITRNPPEWHLGRRGADVHYGLRVRHGYMSLHPIETEKYTSSNDFSF